MLFGTRPLFGDRISFAEVAGTMISSELADSPGRDGDAATPLAAVGVSLARGAATTPGVASFESHRQIVLPLMAPTRPVSCACRASSARLHRARGTPCVAGNSQARALAWTMTSGGENPRPARPVAVVQPREPSLEEALAPLGYHFSATVQLLGDLVVPPSVGGAPVPAAAESPLLGAGCYDGPA